MYVCTQVIWINVQNYTKSNDTQITATKGMKARKGIHDQAIARGNLAI